MNVESLIEFDELIFSQKRLLTENKIVRQELKKAKSDINRGLASNGYFNNLDDVVLTDTLKKLLKLKRRVAKNSTSLKQTRYESITIEAKLRLLKCKCINQYLYRHKNKEIRENIFFELVKIRYSMKRCLNYYLNFKLERLKKRKKVLIQTFNKVTIDVKMCLELLCEINNLIKNYTNRYGFSEINLKNRTNYSKKLSDILIVNKALKNLES